MSNENNQQALPPLPLLPPLTPGGNPILLFDNSTLDLYNNCPREGEYGHIRNWVSSGERGALNFGAAAHEGWKWRYQHRGYASMDLVGQEAQNTIISKFFDAHPQPLDEFRSPSLCLELMARYNEYYQNEPFTIVTNPRTGRPCVEQSVMVFLGTVDDPAIANWPKGKQMALIRDEQGNYFTGKIDLYYTGRIDLIVRDSSGLWVLDHKTTFQFGKQFSSTMSMTAQFLGYSWAWQQMTGELPTGYVINAVRVRRPINKSILAEDYFRVSGPDPDFARLPFYITQDLVDEWKENCIDLIKTILYHHSQGTFPMNRSSCQRKYGACQFFEVCNCARQSRLEILNSTAFQQNEWSPLNKLSQEQEQTTKTK